MYHLSSLYDRIRLEEAARAQAQEYLRDADVPIWQIDPDELARCVIARANLSLSADDPAKAKACCIDACRRLHAELLRDAIRAHRGDDVEHVRQVRLLWIRPDSLEELGDIADDFTDGYWGDDDPDGDLLLSPLSHFRRADLAAALDAGGKIVHGYEFAYPCSVGDDLSLPRGWCGYKTAGEGYALQRDVAIIVWATSVMGAIKENDGDLEYTLLHCRCI